MGFTGYALACPGANAVASLQPERDPLTVVYNERMLQASMGSISAPSYGAGSFFVAGG